MNIKKNLRSLRGCKPKNPIIRFHYSYVEDKNTGCWVWQGKSRSGSCRKYGRIKVNGKNMAAHRFSWELYFGEIPRGLLVCHKCDNPECVNPKHLFIGTQKDNMKDMKDKGRQNKESHLGYNFHRGERNYNSRLRDGDVLKIRKDIRPQRTIAKQYNVSQTLISKIKKHEIWRHIK